MLSTAELLCLLERIHQMKLEAKVEENDLMPIQLFDDGDVVRGHHD